MPSTRSTTTSKGMIQPKIIIGAIIPEVIIGLLYSPFAGGNVHRADGLNCGRS